MPTCIPRKLLKEVNVYGLDVCGRIVTGSPSAIYGPAYRTILLGEAIEEGEEETVTNVAGATCIADKACPVDKGTDLTLTGCNDNIQLASLLGLGRLSLDGESAVDGYDRTAIDCTAAVAVELVWQSAGLCDALGVPKCPVTLYPYVVDWSPTEERTVDGKTTLFQGWKGRTKLNGRLFEDGIPAALAHWTPWAAVIAGGDAFSLDRTMECPAAKTADCDLQTVAPAV